MIIIEKTKNKKNITENRFFKDKTDLLKQFNFEEDKIIFSYINICCFNEINTIFGYDIGNHLLLGFADRLTKNNFECYRIHGDEFVIISYGEATNQEIDTFNNYIFDLLTKEPFKIKNEEIFLTIRMGITISNEKINKELDILNLIYNANIAMKYAKSKKIQYAIYDPKLMTLNDKKHEYFSKNQIIAAINNKNIFAVYQPIIDNRTQKVIKYESLIRIQGVESGIMNINNFLKLSRNYNLYNSLTKFMINEVFNKVLSTNFEISLNISVSDIMNLSTNNLIINKLKKMPHEKREKIIFELLESEEIEDYKVIEKFITEVKSYGCKIAIDDFGTGYSNFSSILNMDIDYLKIDGSIIKNLLNDKNSEIILKLIISLAKEMKIKTIAEYVHSKEIYNKVKELKIDYSQGFYFSEPIILNRFEL